MIPTLLVGDYLFVSNIRMDSRHSLPFSLPLSGTRVQFCPERVMLRCSSFPRTTALITSTDCRLTRRQDTGPIRSAVREWQGGRARTDRTVSHQGSAGLYNWCGAIQRNAANGFGYRILEVATISSSTIHLFITFRPGMYLAWAITVMVPWTAGCCGKWVIFRWRIWSGAPSSYFSHDPKAAGGPLTVRWRLSRRSSNER